ncbi:MAG TPA: SCO family protein [Flavobacterium sp.]|nr:SCO family protein [Flavobacterium sp.]
MKNKSYIGISFIILVFGIYAVPKIVGRIQNGTVSVDDRLNVAAAERVKNESLATIGRAPEFSLTDQNGKTVTDKDYLGKVYVVEFFFSTCPTICPVMNQNMLLVESQFGKNKDFGIASFTINPENDTPQVLKKHANELGVTSPNWHFLTGSQKIIYEIANKGYNIYAAESKQKGDAGFEHSGYFALVDKKGYIRSRKDSQGNPIIYYAGLNFNDKEGFEEDLQGKYKPGIFAIKEDIELLLKE